MGACMPSGDSEISEKDDGLHKELKPNTRKQVKVLLLGTGDSGKSTILKQIQLIHRCPFSSAEMWCYRQLIFTNLTRGLECVIDEMENMGLEVSLKNRYLVPILEDGWDVRDNEPFPVKCRDILKRLWEDPNV